MMRDPYPLIIERMQQIRPDFPALQNAAAVQIFQTLLPFIKRGDIDTIIDVGCGPGDILRRLQEELATGCEIKGVRLKLIGLDLSTKRFQTQGGNFPDVSLDCFSCLPNQPFIDRLSDLGILPEDDATGALKRMSKIAVLCIGHTIFHLEYLDELFRRLSRNPYLRPALWVVDIHHSWDAVLSKINTSEIEVVEPIHVSSDRRTVDVLFTKPNKNRKYVTRGLERIVNGVRSADLPPTRQIKWTSNLLKEKFSDCGYMEAGRSRNSRGWGEMETYIFSRISMNTGVSSLFMDRSWRDQGKESHLGSASWPQDVPQNSPIVSIFREGIVSSLMAQARDANCPSAARPRSSAFDFLMIEFAPWYDLWQGHETLQQEILLCTNPNVVRLTPEELIQRYNGITRLLQRKNLGLFLHPHLVCGVDQPGTDLGDPRGPVASHFYVSRMKGEPIENWQADWIAWGEQRENDIGKAYKPFSKRNPHRIQTLGQFTASYDHVPFNMLEVRNDGNKILDRIRTDHGNAERADIWKRDYTWVLQLFHKLVRDKLGLNDVCHERSGFTTIVRSAPLRLSSEAVPESYSKALDLYRGAIWIFAGTTGGIDLDTRAALRALMAECLLVANSCVEESAHRAALQNLRRYSVQTATAAIMSRNMSHNLGSNPISRVVANIERKLKPFALVDRKKQRDVIYPHMKFLAYLRDRMDYLAEITTSVPSWGSPYTLSSICKQFSEQEMLRQNLTRVSDLNRCDVQLVKGESVAVLVPHGVLGIQAMNTIFENMIRNSVQNGKNNIAAGKILIVADTMPVDFVILSLLDTGSRRSDNSDRDLKSELQDKFDKTLMDPQTGVLDRENWGLKEIKISAAFLRFKPGSAADNRIDPLGTEGYEATSGRRWVEVDWEDWEGTEYLTYRLILLKPKVALVAGVPIGAGLEAFGVDYQPDVDSVLKQAKSVPVRHQYLLVSLGEFAGLRKRAALSSVQARLPLRVLPIVPDGQAVPDGQVSPGTIVRPNELVSALSAVDPVRELDTLLAKKWNDLLRTRALDGKSLELVIAEDKGSAAEGYICIPETDITPEKPLSFGHRHIVHQRHANKSGLTSLKDVWDICGLWKTREFWQQIQAYFPIPAGDDDSLYKEARQNPRAVQRLIEAGLVWLLIVDERISAAFRGRDAERLQLAMAGVFIVPFASEDRVSRAELQPDRICLVFNEYKDRFGGQPGLLIATAHLALLKQEEFHRDDSWTGELRETLEALLGEGPEVEIMVHSGRGLPPELKNFPDTRFLEFANLDSFVDNPTSKSRLVELLLSVRSHSEGVTT